MNSVRYLLLLLLCAFVVASLHTSTARAHGSDTSHFNDFEEIPIDQLLNSRVVTAARHEQSIAEAPNSVTVISAAEIRAHGYETLADALVGMAGMHLSNDRDYEYLGIRGFAPPGDYNTRILVLVDGHPMNDLTWSYVGIGTDQVVDMSLVDRIEVLRGPGSALYGTSAIFGTINIIMKAPADLSGFGVAAGGGSFGRVQGGVTFGTGADTPVRGVISLSSMEMRGPDHYYPEFAAKEGGGWVRGIDSDEYHRLYAAAQGGDFSIRAAYATRTKKIPTAPWGGIVGDPETENTDRVGFVDLLFERHLMPELDGTARAYGHSSLYKGSWPFSREDSSGVAERWVDRDDESGTSWGIEGRLDWRVSSRHRVLAGAETRWDAYRQEFVYTLPSENTTVKGMDRRKTSDFHSIYLQDEYRICRRMTSTLGLHYDRYPTFGGRTTPRMGLVFALTPRTRLKILYGEGFKAPSHGEYLYYGGDFQVPNPHLRPELYRSGEVVIERSWSQRIWTRFAAHSGEVRDLIRIEPFDESGTLQYRNAGRAALRGLEVEVNGRFPGGVEGRGSLTRQEARTLDPEEWAVNSPRWLAGCAFRRAILGDRGAVAFELRHVGERRGVHGTTLVPAYLVADLNLLLPLPVSGLSAALKIRNLGDRRYSDPGGEEVPMPEVRQDGRTWRLTLTRTASLQEGDRP